MTQKIEFEGKVHEFPDDFSQQDIQKALKSLPRKQEGDYIKRFGTATPDDNSSLWEQAKGFGSELINQVKGIPSGLVSLAPHNMSELADPIGSMGEKIGSGIRSQAEQVGTDFGQRNYGKGLAGAIPLAMIAEGASSLADPIKAGMQVKANNSFTTKFNKIFGGDVKELGPYLKDAAGDVKLDPSLPTESLKNIINTAKEKLAKSLGPGAPESDAAGSIYNKLSKLEKNVNDVHDLVKDRVADAKVKNLTGITGEPIPLTKFQLLGKLGRMLKSTDFEDLSKAWNNYEPGGAKSFLERPSDIRPPIESDGITAKAKIDTWKEKMQSARNNASKGRDVADFYDDSGKLTNHPTIKKFKNVGTKPKLPDDVTYGPY